MLEGEISKLSSLDYLGITPGDAITVPKGNRRKEKLDYEKTFYKTLGPPGSSLFKDMRRTSDCVCENRRYK